MKKFLIALLAALLSLLAATALGLGVIHLTDWPYLRDLDALKIPQSAGISREQALENYRAVMRYLSPFSDTAFSLPSLKWSQEGEAHFADCKKIFDGVYFAGAAAAAALALLARRKRLRNSRIKAISGAAVLAIPLLVLAAVAIDFDQAFVLFHQLFFPGATNWIFDANLDPIILILPEEFFLHCALVIAGFWVLASIIWFAGAAKSRAREIKEK